MPDKSRRQRYSSRSKRQGRAAQPAPAADAVQSVPSAAAAATPRVSPAPQPSRGIAHMEKASAMRFANVKKELLSIGVIAGAILIVLVILAKSF